MMRPLLFRAASALSLFAALAAPAAAQEKTPGPKLLPKTVYAYVSVPDVDTFKERVKGSAFGAMLKDEKLQPTYDQIKEKVAEQGGKIEQELGVAIGDLLKVPAGEVSFGVFDVPGAADGGVGMVAILDHGDNDSTVKTLIEKAEAALEKKGAKRSTEEFEGTEIVVYQTAAASDSATDDDLEIEGEEEEGAAGAGNARNVAWFRKDGRVVWGNGTPALEAVLARWDGGHDDTLASNEYYAYVAQKTRSDDREPIFTWYVDPIGATQAVLSRAQGGPPQLQMAAAFLPTLGLTKLKAMGGSVDASTKEFDSINKMFLYVEQPVSGVLGVFQFPPAELSPPAWVPESATMYFGANWDVPAAVQSVKTLVDTFQGPGAFDQLMNRAASNPNAKVHPQKDLLDQLTGRLNMVNFPAAAPRNAAAGAVPAQQPAVVAIGVKDEAKMKDLLAKLSQTQGFPGEKRDFQGTTIYELPMPNPAGGEPGKMAFAVAKENLVFATDVGRMEEILRSGGSALAESAAYKAISEHVPDQVSMVGYSDQKDQLKPMYESLRSGQFAQQVQGFDFSVLPAFEDIAKYLRTTGSYAVPDENGALFVSFSLKMNE